ncbi:MAG: hypothetical protein LBN39_07335 [Planctomycetaceae bacterium]|jgi:D-lyxose ketol-isomerase|nr:hypothetical protein [Planctomycetaceae bacterium]
MNRRECLSKVLGSTAALAALSGTELFAQGLLRGGRRSTGGKKVLKQHDNSFYYNADGSFNQANAKKAFAELFAYHHYTLADVIEDERFWVADFGLGDFARVGMGGIFWLNDKEHGYFGHEIYLLPFQMIPEHSHVSAEDKPAKHEYWQVRNGSIYNFGKGGSKNDPLPQGVTLPKSQLDENAITCFKWQELTAHTGLGKGEAVLTGIGDWHFMMGGPEGAIVTEYACYHAPSGLRFQNKKGKA